MNKNNFKGFAKKVTALACIATMLTACLTGCNKENEEKTAGFEPKLDTQKEVSIEIAGFMGNFEALDQVVNNFNEYYPNVSISYEQNGGNFLAEYINNNKYTDIFMTSNKNIRDKSDSNSYVYDYCVDLAKEDIDLKDIQEEMLAECTVDGKLVRIPLMQNLYGIVVNKSLLEKEGLNIPENYSQLMDCLKKLKAKGYESPIQGSKFHIYSELMVNMAMANIGNDEEAIKLFNEGDKEVAKKLLPVYERLDEIIKNGYTDYEVNSTYPDDNYDKAILKFFEGNVPFWVCSTECVSGMKKRETKSQEFQNNPFEYEFIYAPLGVKGAFEYREPWYGFSINKDSDVKDYAVEFLRFLSTKEQINTMAEIKGMPSVAKESNDDRYNKVLKTQNIVKSYVNNGSINDKVISSFADSCNQYGSGSFKNPEEAVAFFADKYTEQ